MLLARRACGARGAGRRPRRHPWNRVLFPILAAPYSSLDLTRADTGVIEVYFLKKLVPGGYTLADKVARSSLALGGGV